MVIIQIYTPNEIAEETEKAQFYDVIRETIKEHKKLRDKFIVMGLISATKNWLQRMLGLSTNLKIYMDVT